MTAAERKKKLRVELKKILFAISPDDKKIKSKLIIDKLTKDSNFKSSKKILIFASTKNEPDTWNFIHNYKQYKKDFYLPSASKLEVGKVDKDLKLDIDKQGIFSPVFTVSLKEEYDFDIVLVPGLGFDKDFNRLGHGGGWYDIALKIIKAKRIIGICFKEQVIDVLPTATFDVKVDQLITD